MLAEKRTEGAQSSSGGEGLVRSFRRRGNFGLEERGERKKQRRKSAVELRRREKVSFTFLGKAEEWAGRSTGLGGQDKVT